MSVADSFCVFMSSETENELKTLKCMMVKHGNAAMRWGKGQGEKAKGTWLAPKTMKNKKNVAINFKEIEGYL